jgi:hypothetical protein
MKRYLYVTVLIFFVFSAQTLFAQRNSIFGLHAGYFSPKDTKHGMLFGATLGKAFDESVDIALGLDVFHTSYTDEAEVAKTVENGITMTKTVTSVEYSRTILPITLNVNVKVPAGRYFGYHFQGGLNYDLLFSKEKNYKQNVTENRSFGGLGWHGAAGIYYLIGSHSTLIANLFYDNCTVKHSLDESIEGLPVTEKVNLSGLGFKIGVVLDIL